MRSVSYHMEGGQMLISEHMEEVGRHGIPSVPLFSVGTQCQVEANNTAGKSLNGTKAVTVKIMIVHS